jgi:hypothetical protein
MFDKIIGEIVTPKKVVKEKTLTTLLGTSIIAHVALGG